MIVNRAGCATGDSAYRGARSASDKCAGCSTARRADTYAFHGFANVMVTAINGLMLRSMPFVVRGVREDGGSEARQCQ